MADSMMFPATFDEFAEIFGFIDSKEYYTNGSELIQVFRVKQWLENEAARKDMLTLPWSNKTERLEADIERLTQKLECLLCHATGGKLSKSTYSLRTMEIAVNDEVQKCYEEAKAEAIKEFAERLKKDIQDHSFEMLMNGMKGTPRTNEITYETVWEYIDTLVKEMVGDAE